MLSWSSFSNVLFWLVVVGDGPNVFHVLISVGGVEIIEIMIGYYHAAAAVTG